MVDGLTPSQKHVVEYPYSTGNSLKVVSGPGSGKTFTLLHKIHHLIKTKQVRPDEILVLSLTNKAVDNINDKLLNIFEELNEDEVALTDLKEIVEQIGVFTIHGLANKILIENEGMINIIEENGWRGLLKLISSEYWTKKNISIRSTKSLERLLTNYKKASSGKDDQTMLEIIKIMKYCKVFTNDDLVLKGTYYLNNPTEPDSAETFTYAIKNRYKIVLIDEYQDLYPALLPIIEIICKNKQLILFGDSNQSIYGFLGPNHKVIKKLDELHPKEKCETLHLYDNFRSSPEIISAANAILSTNIDIISNSNLVLKSPTGVKPIIQNFNEEQDQLDFLTNEISNLAHHQVKLSDIAILSRTNEHIHTIANHLKSHGLPYNKLASQPDWLKDINIQFLLDLLRLNVMISQNKSSNESTFSNKNTDFNVIVTLTALKGIGNKSIQSLYAASNASGISLWDYIQQIPKEKWPSGIANKKKIEDYSATILSFIEQNKLLNYTEPADIIKEISSMAFELDYSPLKCMNISQITEFKTNMEEMFKILKLASLNRPNDTTLVEWFLETFFDQSMVYHHSKLQNESNTSGSIKLSTIHASKGLEFPITFLVNTIRDGFTMEDNTLYVGMTRARNLLYSVNMNHPKLQVNKKIDYFENEQFWHYYNKDLNRTMNNIIPSMGNTFKNHNSLKSTVGLRSYSILLNRSLYKLCKYTTL